MTGSSSDEFDIEFDDETPAPSWGVEIELDTSADKSIFRSARRVILDGECAQVQLPDGTYEAFPIGNVRKVLSMRSSRGSGYTSDVNADEFY